MSAPKHTPGPWQWVGDSLTHKRFDVYVPYGLDGAHEHICTVNNLPHARLVARPQERADANVRLITAAPELLAALSAMLAMFEESHSGDEVVNDHGGDGPSGCSYCRTIDQARAVLSKVTP